MKRIKWIMLVGYEPISGDQIDGYKQYILH